MDVTEESMLCSRKGQGQGQGDSRILYPPYISLHIRFRVRVTVTVIRVCVRVGSMEYDIHAWAGLRVQHKAGVRTA